MTQKTMTQQLQLILYELQKGKTKPNILSGYFTSKYLIIQFCFVFVLMEYQDVYDVKLKPRILEYLLNDQIPNETDPSPQHCDLQRVVNTTKNLGLLSESETKNCKINQDWVIAVDSWVHRVLSLVSSSKSRNRWTGICLLGVTCQECSSDRLLAWYPAWFDKLLANIQPASDYISVKVATFASLSNLLKRLGKYSDVKKDVTVQAGKLIQPIFDLLLDNELSEVVLEGALVVLCTIIDFFPATFLPHYEKGEAIIVSRIISGQCSSSMMKSYAYFIASLPKSRGDKDSWFVMIQDLLTSIEIHLNDVFQCLEQAPERAAYLEARKSKQFFTCIIPALMLCCSTMLTNSYPVQVTVPVHQLLTLVKRVLMVNGFFSQASLKSMEIMQEGFFCTELPVLQSYGLDLLSAIIKGTSSQLLPHGGYIIRLLKDCLKKCALPMLRTKLYFIVRTLLVSMGIGAALQIAEELTSNAFIDLDARWYLNKKKPSNQDLKSTVLNAEKKRKHSAIDSLQENQNMDYLEMQLQNKSLTSPLSLKIAVLKALQTLLTMGGVVRSDLRMSIDDMLMNVAVNAYNGKWRDDEKIEVMSRNGPSYADFMLAALHALLASLLSQPSVRQPHLVKGLELFRKGKQEAGTKIADFCALALLSSEMLMKLSICDNIPSSSYGCSNEGIEPEMAHNSYLLPDENQTPNSLPNQDETLFNYLLNSYNESEAERNLDIAEQHSRIDTHIHIPMVKVPGKEDHQREAFLVDVDIERNSNVNIQNKQLQGPLSVAEAKPFISIKKGPEMEFSKVGGLDTIDYGFLR